MNFRFRFSIFISICLITTSVFSKSKEEIKNEINKLLTNKYLKNTNYSIRVLSKDKRETLLSINEKNPLLPASTIKILTTSTALSKLPRPFNIKTVVLSDSYPKNGVIKGDIYLKGFGNPLFSSSDLENIVNKIHDKGIRTVDGNIIIDDSYFDNKLSRKEWVDKFDTDESEGPISALTIDYNSCSILIHSSKKIKSTPDIRIFPASLNIKLINNLKVAKVNRRKESVNISLKENGETYTLSVSGKIRPDRHKYYSIRLKNPPIFCGALLKSMLISKGITVRGAVKNGKPPFKSTEIAEHSISLDSLLKIINKHSDNFCADHLLKIIGAELTEKPGSSISGINCISEFLRENNIDTSHYKISDGSGLSKKNRLTTYALSQLLYNNSINKEIFSTFYNSLSIAGVDGTLRHRMYEAPEHANIRGKTGTLNNVTTLAGYVNASNGELLVYTIFMNDFRRGAFELRKLQDKIILLLSEFSR